jgi:hypothetical protein
MTNQRFTMHSLKQRAQSGTVPDVDFLMESLDMNRTITGHKMIDYALGLVDSSEGSNRIKHFLFNGSDVQRNYAALYFKRRGIHQIIDEAVQHGCIDTVQAYSK